MIKIRVLGLPKCVHCEALMKHLTIEPNIEVELFDANVESKLADEIEALLKTENYPIVILRTKTNTVYFYRVDDYSEAGEFILWTDVKIGCVTIDSMVTLIKKYINR